MHLIDYLFIGIINWNRGASIDYLAKDDHAFSEGESYNANVILRLKP